jgi:hypothetical protein
MRRTFLASVVLLLAAAVASADPGPTLVTVFPLGVKAGETVEVVVTGTGFDGEEKLLFSNDKLKAELLPGSATPPPKNPQPGQRNATTAKFKVTAPADSVTSIGDVRLVCKGGLTNPRAFVVGSLPEVVEKEPNNDVAEAQSIAVNSTVNGTIAANTDVDYYLVKAQAKQSLVVSCLTTTLDSRMQADLMVIAPEGKTIAANRGYRDGDAVLEFQAATDGDYLIRVSQFAYTTGGPDHFYRLTVSTGPWFDAVFPPVDEPGDGGWKAFGKNLAQGQIPKSAASHFIAVRPIAPTAGMIDAIDPFQLGDGHPLLRAQKMVVRDNGKNQTPDAAQPVTVPCDVAGQIEKKGARHWYTFDAKKGDVWTLEVFADRLGSPVDAYFVLTDEKGKVIVEQDDGPDTLSPNQFYTKSDDPGRYRFSVPADGKYRVMVSTREAAAQFGPRDQYVLRIAPEQPGFRLAVMPAGTHYLDAGTVAKGGSVLFNIYAWRFDGFDGPITLTTDNLPKGLTCSPQILGANQSRGVLVLTAADDAADWAGFITVRGSATAEGKKLTEAARPFSIIWPIPGVPAGQPAPNTPMLARLDRGPGLALAIRGDAPFLLTTAESGPIKAAPGGKIELTVKVKRDAKFKDAVQIYSATPGFGPRQQGGQPPAPVGTIAADKSEVKVTLDVGQNTLSGQHTLVLRGVPGAAAPKGGNQNQRVPVSFPTSPITIEVEGKKK